MHYDHLYPFQQDSVHDLKWVSNDSFTSCGLNHIFFWTLDKKTLRKTRGIFGRKVPKQVKTTAHVCLMVAMYTCFL